jgi:hypothetical protein
MTEISNPPKEVSSNQVLVRFGLRLVILGACASFGSVGFGRSLGTLLLLSVVVCAVTGLIRRETPFGVALTHWDEGVAYGALYCLASAVTYPLSS